VTQNSVRGVSYTNARKKRFRNAISVCALLRKNLWNGVPARSITKIPLSKGHRNQISDASSLSVFPFLKYPGLTFQSCFYFTVILCIPTFVFDSVCLLRTSLNNVVYFVVRLSFYFHIPFVV
jgi:hypothetical protein